MKSANKWKTVSDLGIEIEESCATGKWMSYLMRQSNEVRKSGYKIIETHAHLNLNTFAPIREALFSLMKNCGIQKIIVPAIEYSTNFTICELFDKPEYSDVFYAFGAHPKTVYNEDWNKDKLDEFTRLLQHKKVKAVGEIGLDYSYNGFDQEHRKLQMELLSRFIKIANEAALPTI